MVEQMTFPHGFPGVTWEFLKLLWHPAEVESQESEVESQELEVESQELEVESEIGMSVRVLLAHQIIVKGTSPLFLY